MEVSSPVLAAHGAEVAQEARLAGGGAHFANLPHIGIGGFGGSALQAREYHAQCLILEFFGLDLRDGLGHILPRERPFIHRQVDHALIDEQRQILAQAQVVGGEEKSLGGGDLRQQRDHGPGDAGS